MATQTTEKKKGLFRGLLRLGKLTKKDGKSSCKQAPPSTVKRKPATPMTAAAGSAAQSTERRDVDKQQEQMYDVNITIIRTGSPLHIFTKKVRNHYSIYLFRIIYDV